MSSRKSDSTILTNVPIKTYKHNSEKDANRSEQFKTVYTGLKATLKKSKKFEYFTSFTDSKYDVE